MVGAYYGYEELDQKYTLQFEEEMQIGWSIGAFGQPTWNELNFVSGGVDAVSDFGSPHASQESETWSIFTHNVFSVTDKLDVTLGLRYAEEEKDGSMQEQDQDPRATGHASQGAVKPPFDCRARRWTDSRRVQRNVACNAAPLPPPKNTAARGGTGRAP